MGEVLTEQRVIKEWVNETKEFNRGMNNFKVDLLARQDEEFKQREIQHRQNQDNLRRASIKQNWILVIAALGTMIFGGLTILVTIQLAKHQSFNIPDFLHSQNQQQETARETILPPTYQMR